MEHKVPAILRNVHYIHRIFVYGCFACIDCLGLLYAGGKRSLVYRVSQYFSKRVTFLVLMRVPLTLIILHAY